MHCPNSHSLRYPKFCLLGGVARIFIIIFINMETLDLPIIVTDSIFYPPPFAYGAKYFISSSDKKDRILEI